MIEISIASEFEHYSCYNVIAMCGGFDASGVQLYVASAQKAEGESVTTLKADSAQSIELIIYVVPEVLPPGKNVRLEPYPPYDLQIIIKDDNAQIYSALHSVNVWGGAAVKLNLNLNESK